MRQSASRPVPIWLRHLSLCALLLALACASGPVAAEAPPANLAPVTPPGFAPDAVAGVRLLTKHDGSDQASVFAVMLSGIGDQGPGEAHCAHIAEHMVFRNPLAGGPSLAATVDAWGGAYNGWTGPDHTQYELTVPQERLSEVLPLLIQALFPADLDEAAYQAEMTTGLGPELQFMTTNGLSAQLNAVKLAMFRDTAYDEDLFGVPVESVPPDRVFGYLQREYSRGRLILTVVGALEPAEVAAALAPSLAETPLAPPPAARLTELTPSPGSKLLLDVPGPSLSVAAGYSAVAAADCPYVRLGQQIALQHLLENPPPGLQVEPTASGLLPAQGAGCLVIAYAPVGRGPSPASLHELAWVAQGHVATVLGDLTELVTPAAVAPYVAPPADPPELPAHVHPTMFEAWRAGLTQVPGLGADLNLRLGGIPADELAPLVVERCAVYADDVATTAVLVVGPRGTTPWLVIGGGVVLLLGLLAWALLRRRRRADPPLTG